MTTYSKRWYKCQAFRCEKAGTVTRVGGVWYCDRCLKMREMAEPVQNERDKEYWAMYRKNLGLEG